jgi:hypothetical protein
MKGITALVAAVLACSLLAIGCGSDSPSTPSAPPPTPEPKSLSGNISGTWSGQATMFGAPTNVTLSINQPVSDTSLTGVQSLTGKLSLANGSPLAVTGSKQGDMWSVSGSAGSTIATVHQTLTSANASSGDFTLQVGSPNNQGTVALNLTKS